MIRYERFGKRYGAERAVQGLDLSVERGEVVALLGPNGSGKTTALKAAAGLLLPSEGAVLVGGRPAADPAARRLISFLPQKVSFEGSLTGREVLEFFASLRGLPAERVPAALEVAVLNGASAKAVSTYSGGMVQRLGLGVAALPEAEVLLLDEPTAALDPRGLASFYALVDAQRKAGRTVLFTSHQLADVSRLADRVAVLVGGRLETVLSRSEVAALDRIEDLYGPASAASVTGEPEETDS